MSLYSTPSWMLEQEARALLTRLERMKPFALLMPTVAAAAISQSAQTAIEYHLANRRRELRRLVHDYIRWLRSPYGWRATPEEAQKRFTFLRLQFNAVLSQFDIFSDVLTQRSEHDNGVWLSGLDAVAADALKLPGHYYETPPVICYLDRGHGAAIRRARTRLPGGDKNPVAIIRVPRERMVGSGIASSLIHEVGHQGSDLLNLVESLRPVLQGMQRKGGVEEIAWKLWERWISEILADFWSVAWVGIASTLGLIGVVSLPRPFVFRINMDDPHPFPWMRVKLSCAMGNALYPHKQWDEMARLWESFYPRAGLDEEKQRLIRKLETTIPGFIALLVNHRPRTLLGKSLIEVMSVRDRQPARLAAYYQSWRSSPAQIRTAPPSFVFAVIGQAKADGKMRPEDEIKILTNLLTHWALRSTLSVSATCAALPMARVSAPVK